MDVLLTYDNLGESYDLLRYGHAGGASADGIYAVRRGIPRILEMLARNGLHATFFVEGWGRSITRSCYARSPRRAMRSDLTAGCTSSGTRSSRTKSVS